MRAGEREGGDELSCPSLNQACITPEVFFSMLCHCSASLSLRHWVTSSIPGYLCLTS